MDQHRLGTCSSCEAQYRVPATFKANKAKCKKCGGVVEIGPVQGQAAPAAKPAPARKPRGARPAVKAGGIRSKQPPAKAKARVEAKVEAEAPAKAPAAKGESVRSAAESAAARVRGSGDEAAEASKPKAGRSSSRRKARPAKKKSKTGLVLGIVALLLIAGGGGWFLMNKDAGPEAQAAETLAAAENEPAAGEATSEEAGGEAAASASEETSAPVEAEEAAGEEAPAAEEAPPPAKKVIDLTELPDLGPAPGTSDEEWQEINALVATAVDPAAGAKGGRARNALQEKGRLAFPAVLNKLKTLDLGTQSGYRDGDLLQKLLEDICRGNNFGWKYTTEEADVTFNKGVVVAWFKSWNQVVGEGADGSMWVHIAKLNDEEKAAYLAEIGLEAPPAAAAELEDF